MNSKYGYGYGYHVLVAISIGCLLWPILSNSVPLLMDYPGHLSRVHILYNLLHETGFSEAYTYKPIVVPNLAIDVVCLVLMEMGLPIEISGRIFLTLMMLGLGTGIIALHYAIFRHRSYWPLLALPFLYQDILFYGFVNFFFGLGIAFWGAALWQINRTRNIFWATIILAIFSTMLFFCHQMALLLMAGIIIGRDFSAFAFPCSFDRDTRWQGRARLIAGITGSLLPLGLMIFSPIMNESSGVNLDLIIKQFTLENITSRLFGLKAVYWGYDSSLDRISALLLVGAISFVLASKTICLDRQSILPICGLIVIYVMGPSDSFSANHVSGRLTIVIFMLGFATTDIALRWRWESHVLPMMVLILSVLRGSAVEAAWSSANAAFVPILKVFDGLPVGARIYFANAHTGSSSGLYRLPFGSLPGYAVIRRNAFWSGTFASPLQNFVSRTPIYQAAGGQFVNYHGGPLLPENDPYAERFLAFFDYVMIVNPELWPHRPPEKLKPLVSGPGYTFFKIEKNRDTQP